MNRDDAITLILNRCGNRAGDSTLRALIEVEMRFAQEQLETGEKPTLPWFLKVEYTDAAFKTAVSGETVALPTGFLREWQEVRVALFYQDAAQDDEWVPIEKVDYDEGKTEFGGESNGAPQAYTLVGGNIRLWPAADAEYPLKLLMHQKDTLLSTNIENAWLANAGNVLIGKTGVAVGLLLRDQTVLQFFSDMEQRGRAALHVSDTAREEAGRARAQGESE